MSLAIEKTTQTSKTAAVTAAMVPVGLLLALNRATREEDAAIDAESILEQAEEANALDPVG